MPQLFARCGPHSHLKAAKKVNFYLANVSISFRGGPWSSGKPGKSRGKSVAFTLSLACSCLGLNYSCYCSCYNYLTCPPGASTDSSHGDYCWSGRWAHQKACSELNRPGRADRRLYYVTQHLYCCHCSAITVSAHSLKASNCCCSSTTTFNFEFHRHHPKSFCLRSASALPARPRSIIHCYGDGADDGHYRNFPCGPALSSLVREVSSGCSCSRFWSNWPCFGAGWS